MVSTILLALPAFLSLSAGSLNYWISVFSSVSISGTIIIVGRRLSVFYIGHDEVVAVIRKEDDTLLPRQVLRDCDKRTVLIPFMLLQIYSPEAVNNIYRLRYDHNLEAIDCTVP